MSTLQDDFNSMNTKIVRCDEFKASLDQAKKERYKGLRGKLAHLIFFGQSLGDIPRLIKNFNKLSAVMTPNPAHVYVDENYINARLTGKNDAAKPVDSTVYMDLLPLLEGMRDALGEKAMLRSPVMDGVKRCPDHQAELGKSLIALKDVNFNSFLKLRKNHSP